MESFSDNNDREVSSRRAARIEQMKKEKQLQEQRRRMLKKLLPYTAGGIAGIVVLVAGVLAFSQKEEGEESRKAGEAYRVEINENRETESAYEKAASVGYGKADETDELKMASAGTEEGNNGGGEVQEEKDDTEPEFVFEEPDSATTIYSDNVISTNAILVNESTDTVIASKDARARINPASMTKVLTVLVASEAITEEELDNTFSMTQEIADYSYVNDCSSVGFLAGEEITLRDLFYGTILQSGGDAAVGLATYIAGSHEAFVDRMNRKLKELGISESTHFTNCVGLYDDNHYSTAYDMAIIMKAAMQNELCRDFLSMHTYTTKATGEHPEGITISNWFLRKIEDKDTNGEIFCAKTGYVVQSKNCAVSYEIHENGNAYICVTTGATSSWRCIYDHVEIYTRYIE